MMLSPYVQALVKRIQSSGVSKRRLSKEAAIAYTTLDRLMTGKVSPTIATCDKIRVTLDRLERIERIKRREAS